VTFAEVPDEITLCINITGCKNGCKNCHSSYLAQDIGERLSFRSLHELIIEKNKGISCVAFMGGDSDPSRINTLASFLRAHHYPVKIAWYSGRQELSNSIDLFNFDYIKLGPYKEEFGPLNSRTTNQRFYKVNGKELEDITSKFWKHETEN
jgi:anaerobic ribonucleoside-triphosphate reductase activating protein